MLKSKWCLVLGILAVGLLVTAATARDSVLTAGTVVPEGMIDMGTLQSGAGAAIVDGDVVFRNMEASGYFYGPGADWGYWDDIQLEPGVNGEIAEYTVRVVGLGDPYEFRTALYYDTLGDPVYGEPGAMIPGSDCVFVDVPSGGWVSVTCVVDAGVVVPDAPGGFWLGMDSNDDNAGAGIAGGTGTVGFSDDFFAKENDPITPTGYNFYWFGGCPVCGSFRAEIIAAGVPWACCDLTTYACENMLETECEALGGMPVEGTLCNNLDPPCSEAGACCDTTTGVCEDTFALYCDGYLQMFYPGELCAAVECPVPPNVPTLTQWGMIALTVVLLTGLTIRFGRRRTVTA